MSCGGPLTPSRSYDSLFTRDGHNANNASPVQYNGSFTGTYSLLSSACMALFILLYGNSCLVSPSLFLDLGLYM